MKSKSDHAWRMAAQCARLAQEADQKDEREFYVRMRDSWITVANRYAFLDIVDEHGTPAPLSPSRARRALSLRQRRLLLFQFLDLLGQVLPLLGNFRELQPCIRVGDDHGHAFAVGGLLEAPLYLRRFHPVCCFAYAERRTVD